ncbi:hypothetical protein RRG08_058280 [Elysia crispata]|uniref:Uncharacterized protein n=1 Tax=Elysia crispata TaxID=231223 RepID=A0AAE1D5C5_9GAST|nr:hypothetical protein RRG08_058280 [Elysia crispata]
MYGLAGPKEDNVACESSETLTQHGLFNELISLLGEDGGCDGTLQSFDLYRRMGTYKTRAGQADGKRREWDKRNVCVGRTKSARMARQWVVLCPSVAVVCVVSKRGSNAPSPILVRSQGR